METGNHRVEVYVDGSMVFTTREPGESFAGEPICSAAEAFRHFGSIQAMPQEVFAVMSLNGANKPIKTRCPFNKLQLSTQESSCTHT